jgi:sulfate-transporting ATPase
MAQFVLTMKDVKKVFPGGKTILKGLYLSFLEDAKIGILGHNGAGKSTFMKIVAGLDKEISGEIWVRDGIKIGYLAQEPQLNENLSVKENIMESVKEIQDLIHQFNELSMRFAEEMTDDEMDKLLELQGSLQNQIDSKDAWDLDRQIDMAMDALRCPDGDSSIKMLSGGEKRRIALCKLLLEKPDILLLDEPTNHLDAESVAWLERYLKEYKGMVLVITHDKYFLDNITNWILELERAEGYPYEGNYSAWLAQKQKRLAQEEKEESVRQRTLKKELEWVSQSPKARQAKSKARITSYEALLAQANEDKAYESSIIIPVGPKLGEIVIEVKDVSKAFENRLLIDKLSFTVPRGAVVGIVGANGAGKSTMFKMITGQEKPDSGSIRVGESVVLGYVDQSRDSLNDANTVWQEISDGMDQIPIGNKTMPSRAYTAQFNFKGSDQQKKIAALSGGERNRVHLAKMLKSGANVLLLDEPTNDLDVETLSALEEAILEYVGCVLVISHDRWFLNRIATHILAFEGDSKVIWNEGNYTDYEEDKVKRLGVNASQPSRIKYKPLS